MVEGMFPWPILRFPVNSSTHSAHMQFSLKYQDGYELKCPSFHVISVRFGLTRLTSFGMMYCKIPSVVGISYQLSAISFQLQSPAHFFQENILRFESGSAKIGNLLAG